MTSVIHSELLKIRTTKAWWILGLLMLVFTGLALAANMAEAHFTLNPPDFENTPGASPEEQAQIAQMQAEMKAEAAAPATLLRVATSIYTSGQLFGVLLVMLLGVLIVTSEFQHQTVTTTFLTTPRRTLVIVAKLIVAAALAVFFWAVTTGIDLAAGAIFFDIEGREAALGEWPVVRAVLLNLAVYAVWAVFGVGLGVLIRNQIGAVVTATLLYLLSFPVAALFFGMIRNYLIKEDWVLTAQVIVPSIASTVMTTAGRAFEHAPPQWVGAVVLIGYAVVAGVIGTLVTRRRDIS